MLTISSSPALVLSDVDGSPIVDGNAVSGDYLARHIMPARARKGRQVVGSLWVRVAA